MNETKRKKQLENLKNINDDDIDYSDITEITSLDDAEIGKFYKSYLCKLHDRGKQQFGWFEGDPTNKRIKKLYLQTITEGCLSWINKDRKTDLNIDNLNETIDYVSDKLKENQYNIEKDRPEKLELAFKYLFLDKNTANKSETKKLKQIFPDSHCSDFENYTVYDKFETLKSGQKISIYDVFLITALWLIDIGYYSCKEENLQFRYYAVAFSMMLDVELGKQQAERSEGGKNSKRNKSEKENCFDIWRKNPNLINYKNKLLIRETEKIYKEELKKDISVKDKTITNWKREFEKL